MERALPWLLRAAWALLPVASGPALATALDGRSDPVQTVASVGLWAGWSVAVLATLVPHPVGLTALRIAAPGAVAANVWAAATGAPSPTAAAGGTAHATLALLLVLSPAIATFFVNGPAYPNERRFPLKVPGALLAGPMPVAASLVIGLPVAALLLLAVGRVALGAAAAVVAVPAAIVLGRALHGLARRWLVFVPAGVVIHDPLALADPVLFPKEMIASFGPAPASSEATDLTLRALGLALELRMKAPAAIVPVARRRSALDQQHVDAVLVTPARPGAVMREAEARGFPLR